MIHFSERINFAKVKHFSEKQKQNGVSGFILLTASLLYQSLATHVIQLAGHVIPTWAGGKEGIYARRFKKQNLYRRLQKA